ncbi:hypothetical protein FPV67DRAFT_1382651, partial [Lyophyllum atratum]
STTEISINLNIPLRVVQRAIQTWNKIGEVCRNRRHMGRAPLLSPAHTRFLLALLEHSPDMYLDEIQEQMLEQHDINISIPAIWRTLKRLGIGLKKLSKMAAERSEEVRRKFIMEIGAEPPEYLVMADEAAVNILTTYRSNGWS